MIQAWNDETQRYEVEVSTKLWDCTAEAQLQIKNFKASNVHMVIATAEEAAATEEPVHVPISNTTGHVMYNAVPLSELGHVARRRRMPDISNDKATLVQVLG